MTNKPMLSVDREMLEIYTGRKDGDWVEAGHELRSLLDKEVDGNSHAPKHQGVPPLIATLHENGELIAAQATIAQQAKLIYLLRAGSQGEPVAVVIEETHNYGRYLVFGSGGSEVQQPRPVVERKAHLFDQTLPIGTKLYAEKPAPVADHTQCEECKGWGYHENHHEGGGTECGECSGSGKAPVEQFSADTVVCRRYQLEQHPGQNFYHYDLEPVYGSVPVTVSELITMVESAPVAVVMPERREPSPSNPHLSDADHEYNSALDDVARLNGVKP